MGPDELAYLWFTVNLLYLASLSFLFFRYRSWRWVAVLKLVGFALVLVFLLAAGPIWLFVPLPTGDLAVYAIWAFIAGYVGYRFAREGIAHILLIQMNRPQEVVQAKRCTFRLKFSRNGMGEPELTVTLKKRGER